VSDRLIQGDGMAVTNWVWVRKHPKFSELRQRPCGPAHSGIGGAVRSDSRIDFLPLFDGSRSTRTAADDSQIRSTPEIHGRNCRSAGAHAARRGAYRFKLLVPIFFQPIARHDHYRAPPGACSRSLGRPPREQEQVISARAEGTAVRRAWSLMRSAPTHYRNIMHHFSRKAAVP